VSTKQERTARASKRAAAQADTIIAEATERARLKRCKCGAKGTAAELKAAGHPRTCATKVAEQEYVAARTDAIERAKAPQTDATARTRARGTRVVVKPASDPQTEQGAEVVRLRNDEQLSWMAIGAKLGLPGAKNGAANARKLYAAHTGQSHKAAPTTARAPRNNKRHAAQVGSKTARREVVQARGGFFTEDTTDEEVVALVHGKTIEWSIDLARLAGGKGAPEWCDQEARVHSTDVYVKDVNGERCLNFRTLEGRYEDGKPIAGPTRTVRLAAIHTVR
jgi:hypothetical protein